MCLRASLIGGISTVFGKSSLKNSESFRFFLSKQGIARAHYRIPKVVAPLWRDKLPSNLALILVSGRQRTEFASRVSRSWNTANELGWRCHEGLSSKWNQLFQQRSTLLRGGYDRQAFTLRNNTFFGGFFFFTLAMIAFIFVVLFFLSI